jgi:hypothetical protein
MIPKPSVPGADLLFGAAAISNFMLGSKTEGNRKRIYGLVRKRLIPTFYMGATVCARKSSLVIYLEEKERTGGDPPPRKPRGKKASSTPEEARDSA